MCVVRSCPPDIEVSSIPLDEAMLRKLAHATVMIAAVQKCLLQKTLRHVSDNEGLNYGRDHSKKNFTCLCFQNFDEERDYMPVTENADLQERDIVQQSVAECRIAP